MMPRSDTPQVKGMQILTFGILSLFCFGVVLGPIAWIQGNAALTAIDRGGADPVQRGTVNAGRWCGIVGTFLWTLYIIFYIIGTIDNLGKH